MKLAESLAAILGRELTTVRMEIEAYPTDADVWRVVPGIKNPGGTLALHIAGNLQHFVGKVLGKSAYVRDRDAEFASRDVPRGELVKKLTGASAAVQRVVGGLTPEQLAAPYPELVANTQLITGDFLVHLASHLSYHLGQLDYHRRIVTGGAALSGAVSPTRLWSATAEPEEQKS